MLDKIFACFIVHFRKVMLATLLFGALVTISVPFFWWGIVTVVSTFFALLAEVSIVVGHYFIGDDNNEYCYKTDMNHI